MLVVICALPAERRALARHFRLRRRDDVDTFPCYGTGPVVLVESGVGRLAAAAATGFAQGALVRGVHGFVNIGIAGAAAHSVGDAVLAHTVADPASGRCWHPGLCFAPPCSRDLLTTFDQPGDYPGAGLCDMEASAVVAGALRTTSIELVQVLKVVSDTRPAEREALTPSVAEDLVTAALPAIGSLLDELQALLHTLGDVDTMAAGIDEISARFTDVARFSRTQRNELRRLLHQHLLLRPGREICPQAWQATGHDDRAAATGAERLLARLREELGDLRLQLP